MATSCSALTSLSLNGCPQLEEWTYQALARGCSRLRHLQLNDCHKVTDEAIKVQGVDRRERGWERLGG